MVHSYTDSCNCHAAESRLPSTSQTMNQLETADYLEEELADIVSKFDFGGIGGKAGS